MLARVYGVSAPARGVEPEYLDGLRGAVSAALNYALAAIELGEGRSPPIPTALLAQARLAARYGVDLETVLRRYVSGYTLLADFALQEAEAGPSDQAASLYRFFHEQTGRLDELIAAVTEEYNREASVGPASPEERRAERVKRLLRGELIDSAGLAYGLEDWHVGLVATGTNGLAPLQRLADLADRRLLAVQPRADAVWAWLGGRRRVESGAIAEHAERLLPVGCALAVGEPAPALAGWRLSHNQARAVLHLAEPSGPKVVRYANAGLIASVAKDEILVKSLRQLYLNPLSDERDGGEALKGTIRAYLAAGQHVTSAAAALRLSRQTVTARLRSVEEKLGCPIEHCATELDLALRLEEGGASPPSKGGLRVSTFTLRPRG